MSLTDRICRYEGILYEVQEENYNDTSHQGFGEGQDNPFSLEGSLIGRYAKELFVPERTFLVMQEDENPPTLINKGWSSSPIYFPRGMVFYVEQKLVVILDSDDFVYELITHE